MLKSTEMLLTDRMQDNYKHSVHEDEIGRFKVYDLDETDFLNLSECKLLIALWPDIFVYCLDCIVLKVSYI